MTAFVKIHQSKSMYMIGGLWPLETLSVLKVDYNSAATDRNSFWWQALNWVDDERQMVRLSELMRGYFNRLDVRFINLKAIKSDMIEDLDQRRAFEKGYIMGDIVETYRKGLVFTKKQLVNKRYIEPDRIRYLTYVQNAYIKVYHLVHMMHEIDPKFGTDNTGQMTRMNMDILYQNKTPAYWNTSGFYYTKELEAIRQEREKDRRDKVHKEKRIRQKELDRYSIVSPGTVKTTTNWWPVAYGWDIEYYW